MTTIYDYCCILKIIGKGFYYLNETHWRWDFTIIKITISSIVIGLKKSYVSTSSLAR